MMNHTATSAGALPPLLRQAALCLGLDDQTAAQVATSGAVDIDGQIVTVVALPEDGATEYDLVVAATVQAAPGLTSGAMLRLLQANLPNLLAAGCAFGLTAESELMVMHPARLAATDGAQLARKLQQIAAVAAAAGEGLAQLAAPLRQRGAP
ncbi:hypothetical protein D0T25_24330 [Duganella sp. BJB488]|uniref:CesT family type III secretion system chaperone n=1 Tax=unclassified Duganella TaxID=2636909 RepID=UPI000E34D62E|nr:MULTISPECIES: CesT family type III secretion system chaperone [unclassified Duganella]RFP13215.1 hypothetical protein D0T26_23290 [Duganella sp. BJB489]RFP17210.1 hypothetical protein D0T25_24330 [Duganella sp. BJB488]RFP31570.1 hypothetical protein D0T24_24385 [Duganella sp. BJB480]